MTSAIQTPRIEEPGWPTVDAGQILFLLDAASDHDLRQATHQRADDTNKYHAHRGNGDEQQTRETKCGPQGESQVKQRNHSERGEKQADRNG